MCCHNYMWNNIPQCKENIKWIRIYQAPISLVTWIFLNKIDTNHTIKIKVIRVLMNYLVGRERSISCCVVFELCCGGKDGVKLHPLCVLAQMRKNNEDKNKSEGMRLDRYLTWVVWSSPNIMFWLRYFKIG